MVFFFINFEYLFIHIYHTSIIYMNVDTILSIFYKTYLCKRQSCLHISVAIKFFEQKFSSMFAVLENISDK